MAASAASSSASRSRSSRPARGSRPPAPRPDRARPRRRARRAARRTAARPAPPRRCPCWSGRLGHGDRLGRVEVARADQRRVRLGQRLVQAAQLAQLGWHQPSSTAKGMPPRNPLALVSGVLRSPCASIQTTARPGAGGPGRRPRPASACTRPAGEGRALRRPPARPRPPAAAARRRAPGGRRATSNGTSTTLARRQGAQHGARALLHAGALEARGVGGEDGRHGRRG